MLILYNSLSVSILHCEESIVDEFNTLIVYMSMLMFMHFLDFLTPSLQYAISDRGTARPPLGSTRVAEPFGDGLGVLRELSEKRTLRRIEHYRYALSGRCILNIAPENRSIGKHLSPTSLSNQKGSGPPSTVSSAVGGVVERLRIYQRS